tara:strand:+ start:2211 stop:3137 length:927 start_codon:yes stop_codon:yes gene_type:complete
MSLGWKNSQVGSEIEGEIDPDNIPYGGSFHEDGSVDVSGHCRDSDDCDGSCRDYCECGNYCECSDCLTCEVCETHMSSLSSSCDCDPDEWMEDDCKECKSNGSVCDEHYANYTDRDTYYDCDLSRCSCECECECTCNNSSTVDGEAVSPIMSVGEAVSWLKQIDSYVMNSNRSCGHHLHFGGFTPEEYSWLMEEEFNDFFLEGMRRWGKARHINEDSAFWNRLSGNNSFCKREFRPTVQRSMTDKGSDRYTQLNFCWSLHKTLEVRLLPVFRKKELNLFAFYAVYGILRTYITRKHSEKKDWTGVSLS